MSPWMPIDGKQVKLLTRTCSTSAVGCDMRLDMKPYPSSSKQLDGVMLVPGLQPLEHPFVWLCAATMGSRGEGASVADGADLLSRRVRLRGSVSGLSARSERERDTFGKKGRIW